MVMRNVLVRRFGVPLLCLAVGAAAGWAVRDRIVTADRTQTFFEVREGGYRFINPLLECDAVRDVVRNRELRPFREKIERYLAGRKGPEGAERVAIYFRELNDGLWFSIGDQERFTPASMRKVPMMIAVLKQAERDPALLSRRIAAHLKQDHNAYQTIKPSRALEPGRAYTVAELIDRMIAYSDNNAFMLLSGIVDQRELLRVYEQLSLPNPSLPSDDPSLAVQTYASFFRILYNATYLHRDFSDLALELLSRSEFRAGIVEGVPPGTGVAHKFGEHVDVATGEKQLHDCGIVFYPRHPYLLCIMSRGASFEQLDDTIAAVSRIAYAEVDSQHRDH